MASHKGNVKCVHLAHILSENIGKIEPIQGRSLANMNIQWVCLNLELFKVGLSIWLIKMLKAGLVISMGGNFMGGNVSGSVKIL